VHDRAHLLWRQKHGRSAIVSHHEAVTITMALHGANDLAHETHRKIGGTCHALYFDAIVSAFADSRNYF
jgi:hypothetical protein